MRALEPQIEALLLSQPPKQRTTPEISRLAPRMRQTQWRKRRKVQHRSKT